MHRHDADIIVLKSHCRMIIAVCLTGLPRLPHFLHKVGQSQLARFLSVYSTLIQHIQIRLAGLSIRVRPPGRINARFPHQPPDIVRHRHAGCSFRPGTKLLQNLSTSAVDFLLRAFGASLKTAVERFPVMKLTPDSCQILIRKIEGRIDQRSDQIVIIVQIVNYGQQGQKRLHFREPVKVHGAFIHGRYMHFLQMIRNPAGRSARCTQENDNVAVCIRLNRGNLFRRDNQRTDVPSHSFALRFQLLGFLIISLNQNHVHRAVFAFRIRPEMIFGEIIQFRHKTVHGRVKHLVDTFNDTPAGSVIVYKEDPAFQCMLVVEKMFSVPLKQARVGISESVNALFDVPHHKQLVVFS